MKLDILTNLIVGAWLAKEADRLSAKYQTVASLKLALCRNIQSKRKVPGFLRGLACKYVTNVPGYPPSEPAEPESIPVYLDNLLHGMGRL